jgi:cholesterol oxidase
MVMLGMGHDGEQGRIEKRDGRYQIKWEGMKQGAYRQMVFQEFEKLAAAHGGKYKRLKAFGNNLVTVHPLGGCRMSDDPQCGTTNHLGQVYDGSGCGSNQSGEVHHGLYVADASVIPTALGVNPYMTIGALSERIAHHIVHNPVHVDLFDPVATS